LTEFTSKVHNRPIPQPSTSSTNSKPVNSVDPTPDPSRPASPHHPTPSQTAQLKRELDNQATGEVTREEVNALRGDDNARGVQEVPWRVTVGGGCQDLLFKAFGAIFNPGDSILVETPVYAGVISQFMTLHVNQVEVQVDDQGVSPDSLRQVLSSWPADKPKPKAIYLVPVGSNPTGCSSTTERKLEVLKICVENGIMIIEDDPYYFLAADRRPSYFQLETQIVPEGGHVIRFDSFSKVLSSGMRLASPGFVLLRVGRQMIDVLSLFWFSLGRASQLDRKPS
jgi:DNA-binding transcriptional MocR family regulator